MNCTAIDGITGTSVTVIYPDNMDETEASIYAREEIQKWNSKMKSVSKIELTVDGNEVEIKTSERSPIRRIRRISGYLAPIDNFNAAKFAEVSDRTNHDKQEYNYPSEREKYLRRMV